MSQPCCSIKSRIVLYIQKFPTLLGLVALLMQIILFASFDLPFISNYFISKNSPVLFNAACTLQGNVSRARQRYWGIPAAVAGQPGPRHSGCGGELGTCWWSGHLLEGKSRWYLGLVCNLTLNFLSLSLRTPVAHRRY